MKSSIPLLLILFCGAGSMAQGVFRNQTNAALEKVVQDYPTHFKNIRGELVSSGQQSAEYKSIIGIPGAVSTTITQSGVAQQQLVSWQSIVYSGNEFELAKNRFGELFNEIKNTIIKPAGEKAVIVNGMYTEPSPDKSYTTIQFDLLPASGSMQRLNIDLALKKSGAQWKIILSVYDKERNEATTIVVK
ncbi:MAG: hypothetical protein ABIU63_11880 [Chitinophagaceae bacterium]